MWIISQIWLSWNPPLQSFFGAIFCGVHFGKQWNRKPLPNLLTLNLLGTTGSSGSKESSCNAGDLGSVPGFGRSSGKQNGYPLQYSCGFPGGSDGKESAGNAGDPGLIPGLGRSPGEGNGNPLQYSCLRNSMDIEAWWTTIHGIPKSWTRLSD